MRFDHQHKFQIEGENEETEHSSDVLVKEEEKLSNPAKYAVILHNDDYTTMEFVVEVLMKFFGRSQQEAAQIMLKVHQEGSGVAGIYAFDIAETKAKQVVDYARAKGFPLLCTVEEVVD